MTQAMTVPMGWRRRTAVAWSLAVFSVLVLVAALVLLALNAGHMQPGRTGSYGILAVAVGLYVGTGPPSGASSWPGSATSA